MSDVISFADFLKQANYIFTGFESTIGEQNKSGEYSLASKRSLSRYISNYKNGQFQHLKDEICQYFLNKIRYYIFPEKRQSEYESADGSRVESLDVFSDKCVTLIFQLTGINFSFLRISSENKNKEFIEEQKCYLETLFEMIVSLFKSAEASLYTLNENEKIKYSGIVKCVLSKEDLRNYVKLYYTYARWQLLLKFSQYLVSNYSLFTADELINCTRYSSYAYNQLKHLISESKYDLNKDEAEEKLKKGYQNSAAALKKIVNGIIKILDSDAIEDIKKFLSPKLEREFDYSISHNNLIHVKKSDFFKNPPKEWKNICVQLLLKNYSSFSIKPKEDSIFIIEQFISCALFSKSAHAKALDLIAEKSTVLWKRIDLKNAVIQGINDRFYEFIQQINTIYFFLILKTDIGGTYLLGLKDDWLMKEVYDDNDDE